MAFAANYEPEKFEAKSGPPCFKNQIMAQRKGGALSTGQGADGEWALASEAASAAAAEEEEEEEEEESPNTRFVLEEGKCGPVSSVLSRKNTLALVPGLVAAARSCSLL
jgi:hypothetical protein